MHDDVIIRIGQKMNAKRSPCSCVAAALTYYRDDYVNVTFFKVITHRPTQIMVIYTAIAFINKLPSACTAKHSLLVSAIYARLAKFPCIDACKVQANNDSVALNDRPQHSTDLNSFLLLVETLENKNDSLRDSRHAVGAIACVRYAAKLFFQIELPLF